MRRTNTYPYLSVLIRTYPYKRRAITTARHSGYTDRDRLHAAWFSLQTTHFLRALG
ncbi:MAG: hypothetical protein IJC27_07405 [Lentisphaeria bacterium]|nr:hypothetical protein [Lentisphaeria bacterium]